MNAYIQELRATAKRWSPKAKASWPWMRATAPAISDWLKGGEDANLSHTQTPL